MNKKNKRPKAIFPKKVIESLAPKGDHFVQSLHSKKLSVNEQQKVEQGKAYMKLALLGEWLLANNAWIAGTRIALKAGVRGSGYGYGVIARAPLKVGQSLCIIPKELVISVKTCGVRKEIEDAMIIGEVGTALALMYEKSRGEESKWYPYLSMLPESEPLPYFWDDNDKTYIQGTDVEKIVAKYKGLLQEDYDSLVLPLVEAHPEKFPPEIFTFDNFFKACSLVSSRAFMVDSYHGDSMVPLADLFNHKTAAESAHFESVDGCPVCGKSEGCDHEALEEEEEEEEKEGEEGEEEKEGEEEEEGEEGEEGEEHGEHSDEEGSEEGSEEEGSEEEDGDVANASASESEGENENKKKDRRPTGGRKATDDEIEMVVVRSVPQSGEVYNTFGELSNSCLLTKYGFAEKGNPFDTVDLKAKLIASTMSNENMRERFLECVELIEQKVFEIGFAGTVEPDLIRVLHFCVMPAAAYQTWTALPKKERRRQFRAVAIEGVFRGAEKSKISKIILAAVEERKKRYETTLEEDKQEHQGAPQNSSKRFALILRIAEKEIIEKAIQLYSSKEAKETGEDKKVNGKGKGKGKEKVEKAKVDTQANGKIKGKENGKAKEQVQATVKGKAEGESNEGEDDQNGKKETKPKKTIEKKRISPIIKMAKANVKKLPKQTMTSKYKRKKDVLREKRWSRERLARQRALKAMKMNTEAHEKAMKKRGKWIPYPKLFPLDLRSKEEQKKRKRPIIIDYDKANKPKQAKKFKIKKQSYL